MGGSCYVGRVQGGAFHFQIDYNYKYIAGCAVSRVAVIHGDDGVGLG